MALKSGLMAQIGYAKESTAGTIVTPTKFVPLVSESLSQERERLESSAIIAGRRFLTSEQWNGGNVTVGGDVQHELFQRGVGHLFEAMLGSVATSGSGPYTHTFTPGDLPSLTVQVGRPGVGGTVHPFTYAGCKVASWELACSAGEIATVGLTLVGMTETTATALASASYTAEQAKPFKFNHGAVTIGGSSANVRSLTLSGDNGLADDRRFIGSQTISEPLEAGLRTVDGSMEVEFTDLTQYDRYVNGDEFAIVLAFTSGTNELTVTLNARYDGETPQVGGAELLTENLPFKAVASGADTTAITVELVNGDATLY